MESIKELYSTGKQHFDGKQYAQSENCFKKVIEKGGRYADVFNMLGVISHVEGKFASAIDYFEKALDINPCYTEAILNLAVLYNDLGQYADAKKLYGRLKGKAKSGDQHVEPVLRGKLSNLHADIGDIYRAIGLYKHAIDEYRKALDLNPNFFDIRTKLGQALREGGMLPDSLKELKAVLKANAKYSPALIQMGITHHSMGKLGEAKKCWNEVLKKEPSNESARMYLKLCEAMKETCESPKGASYKKKRL